MKKVFMVLCTVKHYDEWRPITIVSALSREDAKTIIEKQRAFDARYLNKSKIDYFIFEALVITKEKIKEIITNSNVQ